MFFVLFLVLKLFFFLNLFSFSYDNDISLLDILSLADFAGCEHRASLCSSGFGAEIFFVSNKVQFNSIKKNHSYHQYMTVGDRGTDMYMSNRFIVINRAL